MALLSKLIRRFKPQHNGPLVRGPLMHLSFKNVFYFLGSVVLISVILWLGQPFFVPIFIAVLVALILYPAVNWVEEKGVGRVWSIIWIMVLAFFLVAGVSTFFSAEIVDLIRELRNFSEQLFLVLENVVHVLAENFVFFSDLTVDDTLNYFRSIMRGSSGLMVSTTLGFTGGLVSNGILVLIYTFLILLYRSGIKRVLVGFAAPDKKEIYADMLVKIQKVGQQYMVGIFTVMLILGTVNSLGLMIIGLESPLFFGFLAAIMALIPYIGTALGAAIPVIYAFFTMDSIFYPLGIMIYFWFVQFLEGNFLTPRIVGGNLGINALVSIIALIAGAFFWGIAGMILALPFTAMLRILSEHYHELQAISHVLGDDISARKGEE